MGWKYLAMVTSKKATQTANKTTTQTSNASVEHSVVIYGGNGFVGSAIAQHFVQQGYKISCVSRTGEIPAHLNKSNNSRAKNKKTEINWAQKVDWLKGDASKPDNELLSKADIVITTIGSPPIPTFTKKSYEAQYHTNGAVNIQLMNTCTKNNIKHMIIIGAHIPKFLQRPSFAYAKGKQDVVSHAKMLSETNDIKFTIIQPSVIYGTRHTKSGFPIPIGFLGLVSRVIKKITTTFKLSANNLLMQIAPVPVKEISQLSYQVVKEKNRESNKLKVISNHAILHK